MEIDMHTFLMFFGLTCFAAVGLWMYLAHVILNPHRGQ